MKNYDLCTAVYETYYPVNNWKNEPEKGQKSKTFHCRIGIYGIVPARMSF